MAWRRRRRKPKVQWLPNTGTQTDAGINAWEQSSTFITDQNLTFGPGNPTTVIEAPLILDNPPETAQGSITLPGLQLKGLDDETQLSYFLRRIYGELFVFTSALTAGAGDVPAAVLVAAGIIVRRIDPITGTALASGVSDTDPDNLSNNEDPWLWRRSWVLTPINNLLTAGTSTLLPAPDASDDWGLNANSLPRHNLYHTGVHQTPTVDVRTKRRVSAEERLFLDVAVTRMPSAVPPQQSQSTNLKIVFSYRALASLSIAGTNRRNASR